MPDPSLFAWEGFSCTHPEDWAPVVLSGSRAEGYARLQGPGRLGAQIRWKRTRPKADLSATLNQYLQLLERDARRAKTKVQWECEVREGRHFYRHVGSAQGRGMAVASDDGRLFMVEVIGGRQDSLLPLFRGIADSFRVGPADGLEPWALFGMEVRLPAGMSPDTKTLQSGRTWLTFRPRGARLEVGRYAFGQELAARHGIANWARAALRMPNAASEEGSNGLRLRLDGKALRNPIEAIVAIDTIRNQLVAIRSQSRLSKWRPQWAWIG